MISQFPGFFLQLCRRLQLTPWTSYFRRGRCAGLLSGILPLPGECGSGPLGSGGFGCAIMRIPWRFSALNSYSSSAGKSTLSCVAGLPCCGFRRCAAGTTCLPASYRMPRSYTTCGYAIGSAVPDLVSTPSLVVKTSSLTRVGIVLNRTRYVYIRTNANFL